MFTATKTHYADLMRRLSPMRRLAGTLSTGLTALYAAIGQAFADAHNNANRIIDESHPGTAIETIDQWVAAYGLPEPGAVLPASTAEKQALVLSKMTTARGQSPGRMIAIATANGVTATVSEWFDAGRPYTWRMNLGADCVVFRCGTGKCGDKLVDFTAAGSATVQQVKRAMPANTRVEFTDL